MLDQKTADVRKRRLRGLCWSMALSASILVVLLVSVEIDARVFAEMAGRLDLALTASLVLLFAAVQAFRVLRLRWLVRSPVSCLEMTSAALVHQFLASLLPWKLGELSLPLLLRRQDVRMRETLVALMLARLLDLLIVAFLLAVSLLAFWHDLPVRLQQAWPFAAVLNAMALAIVVGGSFARRRACSQPRLEPDTAAGRSAAEPPAVVAAIPVSGPAALARRLRIRCHELLECLREIPSLHLIQGGILSLGMWISAVAFNLLFCCSFCPSIAFGATVVVVLIIPLVNQLPIRGLAGIGTTEAVAVVMFTGAGLSPAEALALGVWGHAFHFGLITVGGMLGIVIRLVTGRATAGTGSLGLIPTEPS